MTTIKTPQSFVTRQECGMATYQNGFQQDHGEADGWRRYTSTTAQGAIWLAFDEAGSWLLAINHAGVIAELGIQPVNIKGPGLARFRFQTVGDLHAAMPRVYNLALSLPDAPLREFHRQTHDMPRTTEAERLAVQRVGQDIFRDRLLKYWKKQCPMTGISNPALLRASHIKPWKDCDTDHERLDVHNGLLLSALWDAALDAGLATFNDDGHPLFSPLLDAASLARLTYDEPPRLNDGHRVFLEWHRKKVFKNGASDADGASRTG